MKYVGINALKEFKTKLEDWISKKAIFKVAENGDSKVESYNNNECLLDDYILHKDGENVETLHDVVETNKVKGNAEEILFYHNGAKGSKTITLDVSKNLSQYRMILINLTNTDKRHVLATNIILYDVFREGIASEIQWNRTSNYDNYHVVVKYISDTSIYVECNSQYDACCIYGIR